MYAYPGAPADTRRLLTDADIKIETNAALKCIVYTSDAAVRFSSPVSIQTQSLVLRALRVLRKRKRLRLNGNRASV